MLDLGGFTQTINSINLDGGAIQNGALVSAKGITSTGGTLSGATVAASGTEAHALNTHGSQLDLAGTNTFKGQGDGAFWHLRPGGVISAMGETNVMASGSNARRVSAGLGPRVKLNAANITADGVGA